tara:strand:- start:830 stop:1069 length:240 start_codon:yes stop_codon:yes gene_type:complete
LVSGPPPWTVPADWLNPLRDGKVPPVTFTDTGGVLSGSTSLGPVDERNAPPTASTLPVNWEDVDILEPSATDDGYIGEL